MNLLKNLFPFIQSIWNKIEAVFFVYKRKRSFFPNQLKVSYILPVHVGLIKNLGILNCGALYIVYSTYTYNIWICRTFALFTAPLRFGYLYWNIGRKENSSACYYYLSPKMLRVLQAYTVKKFCESSLGVLSVSLLCTGCFGKGNDNK